MLHRVGLVMAACLTLAAFEAEAKDFPTKPVQIVVGANAGGSLDTMARLVARGLGELWSQPVVVENKPGANNSVAGQYVANAAPDGYTLDLIGMNHSTPDEGITLGYHPADSFAPIILLAENPSILAVSPRLGVKDFAELVELAKSRPGALNFASSGVTSPPWLATTLMNSELGMTMTDIRYGGASASLAAMLSGEVDLMFGSISLMLPQITEGKVVPLAISTNTRSPLLPDLPTVSEVSGIVNFHVANWTGLLAPAGTDRDIIDAIHTAVEKVLADPQTVSFMEANGFSLIGLGPDEFDTFLRSEIKKWGEVIRGL